MMDRDIAFLQLEIHRLGFIDVLDPEFRVQQLSSALFSTISCNGILCDPGMTRMQPFSDVESSTPAIVW